MAAPNVGCPICGGLFTAFSINSHVNECLNATEMEEGCSNTSESDIPTAGQELSPPLKRLRGDGLGGDTLGQPVHADDTVSNSARGSTSSHEGNNVSCHKTRATAWGSLLNMSKSIPTSPPHHKTMSTRPKTVPKRTDPGSKKGSQSKKISAESCSPSPRRSVDSPEQKRNQSSTAEISSHSVGDKKVQTNGNSRRAEGVPLAERVRPMCLKNFVGQTEALGKQKLIRSLIEAHRVPSMILWGPPGCGKTTLARIIAQQCKEFHNTRFVQMSATNTGVADIKEIVKVARNSLDMLKKRTILFVDEIHRFNKLQQDSFLPHIEAGTIILLGATTENPSFQVNNALLSRCRVVILEKLTIENIQEILRNALDHLEVSIHRKVDAASDSLEPGTSGSAISIEEDALLALAHLCDGDARIALNCLQIAVESKQLENGKENRVVTVENVKDGLQKTHIQYDRAGEDHYNCASALQKSIRGSDDNAAIYWLARMLEGGEDPLFIARRLVVTASEDIGLADPQALSLAVSTFHACQFIGRPECAINLSHCVVYLARCPKSVESYMALGRAQALIRDHQGPLPGVPLHLRNASTKFMKTIGYGSGYNHPRGKGDQVKQSYLPESLTGLDLFKPTS